MGSRCQNASTRATAVLIIGVLFVVGACTRPVAPTALAPAIIAPVTLTPVATPTPAPLTPDPVAGPTQTSPAPALAPAPTPGPNEVWIRDGEYWPNILTVPVGTTVTWTGKDSGGHDVTSDIGLFSAPLSLGGYFKYTFAERGTFRYICVCNPGMEGKIIVE